ncbi:chlorophyll a/b-binding protein domain-containing protein [Pelagophyceae sp. CCMP2097]|nr:chlorophyll a/b-binding protein domain-containing protein [Pelagophyceae sp. CCMP2097]
MARLLQLAVGGSLVVLGSGFVSPRASVAAQLKAGDDDVYAERLDALVEDLKAPAAAPPAAAAAPVAEKRFKPAAIVPKRRIKNSDEWYMLALPFQPRTALLDGTLAADAGFDPAGLATSKVDLYSFREAEVKHSRLAMLCAAGWPLGELWDDGIATTLGLPSIVAENAGRDPSLLNGGLQLINPLYWVGVVALTGVIEYRSEKMKEEAKAADKTWMLSGSWIPGDLGFDPLGLYTALSGDDRGKFLMETAEIKNGRLAMIAVVADVVLELVNNKPVIEVTPIFFKPFWKVVEEVMMSSPSPYGTY